MRTRICLTLVLLALVSPASASAARHPITPGLPVAGGPALASGGVAYATATADGGLELQRDGAAAARFGPAARRTTRQVRVEASPEALAVGLRDTTSRRDRDLIATGSLGAVARPIFECARTAGSDGPYAFSLDRDRVALVVGDCGARTGRRVIIRDVSSGVELKSFPAAAGETPVDVALAWPYVAIATAPGQAGDGPRELRVVHAETGAEAYVVHGLTGDFDLQSDGKVAVTQLLGIGRECDRFVAWHSPAQPFGQYLSGCPARGPVRIAGDRIAFVSDTGARSEYAVVVTDVTGDARTIVRAAPGVLRGTIDFDGSRIAYATAACTRADEIFVDDLGGAQAPFESASCPVRMKAARLRASGGSVPVVLDCPRGCSGSLRLLSGRRRIASGRVAVEPGTGRAAARLNSHGRRTLARGPLRVTVAVDVEQRDAGVRQFRRRAKLAG